MCYHISVGLIECSKPLNISSTYKHSLAMFDARIHIIESSGVVNIAMRITCILSLVLASAHTRLKPLIFE